MNKNDLVGSVAEKSDLSKTDAAKAVDAVFETITGALKTGDEVRLVGFGTFAVTARAQTKGRNPRTGQPVQVAAKKVPFFKAGKELRERING